MLRIESSGPDKNTLYDSSTTEGLVKCYRAQTVNSSSFAYVLDYTKCMRRVISDAHPGGSSGQNLALMPLPRALQSFEARAHFTHFLSPKLRVLVRTHRRHTQIPFISLAIQSSLTTCHTGSLKYSSSNHSCRRGSPTMTSTTLARPHSGHSHQHHNHDNTYLVSANKKDAGVRITRIGLYVNFCMAIGKGLGGYFLNSQSLVADAFHSLTDLVSDFLTLATVSWSLKPPTSRFPGGYGKIESLGSLGVSSLLLAGGIGLGWHSCELLYSQFFLDATSSMTEHSHGHSGGLFGHSHSHNPADMGIPNVHAAWIAGGSIIVKEYLYRASKSSLTSWEILFSLDASSTGQMPHVRPDHTTKNNFFMICCIPAHLVASNTFGHPC